MAEAKKMLKILLRTGETEKRPDLAWERGFKKEPVEVVAVSSSFAGTIPWKES